MSTSLQPVDSTLKWASSSTLPERNFSNQVACRASEWFVLLASGTATDADYKQWKDWLQLDSNHREAWAHIERVNARLHGLPSSIAHRTLGEPISLSRRRGLHALAILMTVGGTGLLTYRQAPWEEWSADYRTKTGETRIVELDDGTQLILNTTTSIDVVYDGAQRLIQLHAGEIVATTGHRLQLNGVKDKRPFLIKTSDGVVRALGTRFSVSRYDSQSSVAVFEGAVEITPAVSPSHLKVFQAGQAATFSRENILSEATANENLVAWKDGLIVADGRELLDVVSELNRHRPGYLSCSEQAAHLRVSGVFKLNDTDGILSSLADVLPIQVRYLTRYWVSINAA